MKHTQKMMMISMGRGTKVDVFGEPKKKKREEKGMKMEKKAESSVLRATANARGEASSIAQE